jgi:hypothetical protein
MKVHHLQDLISLSRSVSSAPNYGDYGDLTAGHTLAEVVSKYTFSLC